MVATARDIYERRRQILEEKPDWDTSKNKENLFINKLDSVCQMID